MDSKKLKISLIKAWKGIWSAIPIIIPVILLIGLINTIIPKQVYSILFHGKLIDVLIGSGLGSILAGNPITSYIISGELLKQGVTLLAVTAFIVSWVTVGIVQLPAESTLLGRKFAVTRNIISFVFSIIVSIITVMLVSII